MNRVGAKKMRAWAAGLGIGLAAAASAIAAPPAAEKPAAPTATATQEAQGQSYLTKVLPELNFNDVAFDDVIAYLRDVLPGFRAVVLRDPGVAAGYPSLTLSVKNIDLQQFFDLLQVMHSNDVEVVPVDGKAGVVYVFKIHPPEGAADPNAAGPVAVHVYRLSEAVEALAARAKASAKGQGKDDAAAEKQALDQVLSLIKATVSQAGDAQPPVLQVHEETRTLIFKGREPQQLAVNEVLSALMPPTAERNEDLRRAQESMAVMQHALAESREREKAAGEQAKGEVSRLRAEMAEREKDYRNQAVELDRLKAKVEELQSKATAGDGKKP